MAELHLLSLSRADVPAAHPGALFGDAITAASFNDIWAEYADESLACFLCDGEAASPPVTMILPERTDRTRVMAVPLCPACAALPQMQRFGRALKLLKKMSPGWHLRGQFWRR